MMDSVLKIYINEDSFLVDLIKSQIFNNQNLNVNIILKVKDITNFAELNSLKLNLGLEQGNIILSESKIMWKNDLQIILNDGLITYDENEISLLGKLIIDAKDINNFYKSFQVKKENRKEIKKIELDFVYNFNKKKFKFDNIKIDKISNEKLDRFVDNYNSSQKIFLNKVTFKNFVNDFFKNYSG